MHVTGFLRHRLWASRILLLLNVVILSLLVGACVESRAGRRLSLTDEKLAKKVIVDNQCGRCHSLQAIGIELTGKLGPDLTKQGVRGRSSEWLRRKLTDPTLIPGVEVVPGFEKMQTWMPKYEQLSKQELTAVVEFLRSLD